MNRDAPSLLFCASDAGGARQLQPVIEEASKREWSCAVLCSAVTEPLFAQSNIAAERLPLTSIDEAERLLRDRGVQVLVVGTTGTIGSERYLTAAARICGIRSMAILDEWYNYALRFRDEEGNLTKFLPDVICVQDELSRKLALQEGLPGSILRITGSPDLAELTLRARAFLKHPPPPPAVLTAHTKIPSILFLSQPLLRAYGKEPGKSGTSGTFLGYQEETVRQDLADILSGTGSSVLVLEKLHPSEGYKKPPRTAHHVLWKVEEGSDDLWPLLLHADVIIGMNTMALLQAAVLGRCPFSYQPHAFDPHLCTAVRLGLADLSTTKEALAKKLPLLLRQKRHRKTAPRPLPFAPSDAAKRVLLVAEELMQ